MLAEKIIKRASEQAGIDKGVLEPLLQHLEPRSKPSWQAVSELAELWGRQELEASDEQVKFVRGVESLIALLARCDPDDPIKFGATISDAIGALKAGEEVDANTFEPKARPRTLRAETASTQASTNTPAAASESESESESKDTPIRVDPFVFDTDASSPTSDEQSRSQQQRQQHSQQQQQQQQQPQQQQQKQPQHSQQQQQKQQQQQPRWSQVKQPKPQLQLATQVPLTPLPSLDSLPPLPVIDLSESSPVPSTRSAPRSFKRHRSSAAAPPR
ncbi:MAG: hypothetical protein MHM6MM_009153 [Cercozoa sp. M6MM]